MILILLMDGAPKWDWTPSNITTETRIELVNRANRNMVEKKIDHELHSAKVSNKDHGSRACSHGCPFYPDHSA